MTEEEEQAAQAAYRRIFFELVRLLPEEERERYGDVAARMLQEFSAEEFPAPPQLRRLMGAELLPWMDPWGGVS